MKKPQKCPSGLFARVQSKRSVTIVESGSDDERYLKAMGIAASTDWPNCEQILLTRGALKVTVLEEYLHRCQAKLLGEEAKVLNLGKILELEILVKRFIIRHRSMLGLTAEDVEHLNGLIANLEEAKTGS